MKRILYIMLIIVLITISCLNSDDNNSLNINDKNSLNFYKDKMREFIINISKYAKNYNNNFIIIPQNGNNLITDNGQKDGNIVTEYINSIEGLAREDLFYGYNGDNIKTPDNITEDFLYFLELANSYEKNILTIDYCSDINYINDALIKSNSKGYIPFVATSRNLDTIPTYNIINENSNDINSLNDAQNMLYIINPEKFTSKTEFINSISNTNYDILIIDLFFNSQEYSADEISILKRKKNGAKRLVISYMSIGEAENYRYYWNNNWMVGNPEWLDLENQNWKGNYKVKYWYSDWQNIIFNSDTSYLNKILKKGFDGVYLDIVDAFEYFEENEK